MSILAVALRRVSVLVLLASQFLSTSLAQGELQCSNKTASMPDATINRHEAPGYVQYELFYDRSGSFWIGVVFEFFGDGEGEVLYDSISKQDSPPKVVEKLTRNFQQSIINSSVYESVDGHDVHHVSGHRIETFLARYEDHVDLYAVHGRFTRGKLVFYRTQTAAEDLDSIGQARLDAIGALNEIIKNCSVNEA